MLIMNVFLAIIAGDALGQETNCSFNFVQNPPWCVTEQEALAECTFEAMYMLKEDPLIVDIELAIGVGDGVNDGTTGAVWVKLDEVNKIYLDKAGPDFTRSNFVRYNLASAGITTLGDLQRLRIGNDSSDFLGMDYVSLTLNDRKVFETAPGFYAAVGNGGSRWWAPADLGLTGAGLAAQDQLITALPHFMDIGDAIEVQIGHQLRALDTDALLSGAPEIFAPFLNGAEIGWNTHIPPAEAFAFTPRAGDSSVGDFLAKIDGSVDSYLGDVYFTAHLRGSVEVGCDAGVLSMGLAPVEIDVTYIGQTGILGIVDSFFGVVSDAVETALTGTSFPVDGGIPPIDIVAATGLPLFDPRVLDIVCPDPSFFGSDLLFHWSDEVSSASGRLEVDDQPELIECPVLFKPDLQVDSIVNNGNGSVTITVRNAGVGSSAPAWLDVFFGLASAPQVGMYSNIYAQVPALTFNQTSQHVFALPASGWVDAIVDTPDAIDEVDETDNVRSVHIP
jgi:hypothetical protein